MHDYFPPLLSRITEPKLSMTQAISPVLVLQRMIKIEAEKWQKSQQRFFTITKFLASTVMSEHGSEVPKWSTSNLKHHHSFKLPVHTIYTLDKKINNTKAIEKVQHKTKNNDVMVIEQAHAS